MEYFGLSGTWIVLSLGGLEHQVHRPGELGQGVGWIMESMLERYPIGEIVGLDVSPVARLDL